MFQLLQQYTKLPAKSQDVSTELKELKYKFKARVMHEMRKGMLRPGTVGETPIHTAFLLEQHELGREMIQSVALREAFIDSITESCREHVLAKYPYRVLFKSPSCHTSDTSEKKSKY
jgi:hypothetical protein